MKRTSYERRFDWPRSEFSGLGALVFFGLVVALVWGFVEGGRP